DVGDIDNDGDVDVLASTIVTQGNVSRPQFVIYRNLGNFAFEQVPGAVFEHGAARLVDFDQDGRLDVWVAVNSTNVLVYRNNGAGFDPGASVPLAAPLPAPNDPVDSFDVIDLDGDGLPELVLGAGLAQAVYQRDGDGFKPITSSWAQNRIEDVADFDH